MQSYDPRTLSWDYYNKLMNELFSSNNLSLVEEKNWKDWARRFIGIGNIMSSGVPDPSGFDDWKKWAEHLTGILNLRSK